MYKNKKIKIIDFGFSKEITTGFIKKFGTSTPNIDIMLAGFIIKLKEMNCPPQSYNVLLKHLNPARKLELGL
jgi:hypothetical protein